MAKKSEGDGAAKGGGGLERDFGYLMPFFDKAAQAAAQLDGPARDEALRLLAGEKERWERLRELFSGAPARQAAHGNSDLRVASPADRAAPASRATAPADATRPGFTVGPLR